MKTRVFVVLALLCFGVPCAAGRTIFAVTASNQLFQFDSANPTLISAPVAITGLVSGDEIHGLDFRPSNGVLYALGINRAASPDIGRIYAINTTTAVATQLATNFSTSLTDDADYGFDFTPTNNVIRVVNSAKQNLRVTPDNGALLTTDAPLADTDPFKTDIQIVGLAYDRNDRNPATATTLFGIDYRYDRLVRIGSVDGTPSTPSAGVVTGIGPTGLTSHSRDIGFDIAEDGVAYSSMGVLVSGVLTYRFYTINLATGAATLIGNIGTGSTAVRGIAALPSLVANIDSGQFFSTIQSAVSAAGTLNGHTIVVNAGTFNELVTVNKSLTILGAKSGVPGNGFRRGVDESIVRGTGSPRSSAFRILANSVTIDGFTIQDTEDPNNFGAGIVMGPNLSGARIRNNIIQNNHRGLYVSNSSETNPLIVERNVFANNKVGNLGGYAIYTDESVAGTTFTNAAFDNNVFQNNVVGIYLAANTAGFQKNIAISNNTMDNNGNAIALQNTIGASITGNTISHSSATQLFLGGVDTIDISENFITDGNARGIDVSDSGSGANNSNIVIGCNFISGNPTAGLVITSTTNAYIGDLFAQHNYWGDPSGPTISSNPGGTGDKIIDPATQVLFTPARSDGTDQQGIAGFQCYPAPVLYGINSANNDLIKFSTNPTTFTSIPITGLVAGETIIGIDFRPLNGELLGLSSGSRLYRIDPATGAAIQRGSSGAFTLNGIAFGFDFNPATDQIRVVSDTGQNLRLNPNNGILSGTDAPVAYAATDPKNGFDADADGTAYTNSYFSGNIGLPRTTLYQIDTKQDFLARQGSLFGTPTSPNSGQLFSIGPLGIDPDDANRAATAFDIYSPVPGVNRAFAVLSSSSFSTLYEVNLVSGAVSSLGPIGLASPGTGFVRGLAAGPTGTLQFSALNYSVSESGSVATIIINRLGGSEGTVSVLLTAAGGTATAGSDYTDFNQVVTFGPGETTKLIDIAINNDSVDEANETILLKLQDQPGGGFLGILSTATLTIVDDDIVTPTLSAQSSSTAAVGEPIFDVAAISSSSALAGTLTFQLFGPNDTSCGGAPIFTSAVTVNGNGNYASASFTPTTPGTYRWVVTYGGDTDHNASVSTGCNASNEAFDATATVLGNIATRLRVETGDNVLIAGFIVTGTQPKKVLVRGIGTSLPLADKLADPTLELRDSAGALIDSNDNWQDSPNKQAIIDTTIPPTSDLESAIVATLPANNAGYTAILRGTNNGTGIGVVEAYDLDRLVDSQLANISTRGFVSTGDNVLIAGTIVVGKNPRNVIVRAIGPSLPLDGKMDDPTLELRDGNGGLIEANDNWVDSPNKQAIINTTIPPTNDKESAIVATLPGNNAGYTAIVRGVNNTTGIAVVEVYALP